MKGCTCNAQIDGEHREDCAQFRSIAGLVAADAALRELEAHHPFPGGNVAAEARERDRVAMARREEFYRALGATLARHNITPDEPTAAGLLAALDRALAARQGAEHPPEWTPVYFVETDEVLLALQAIADGFRHEHVAIDSVHVTRSGVTVTVARRSPVATEVT